MESRDLSSGWTFVTKFVFPLFWIVALGSATLSVWFGSGALSAWLGIPFAGNSNPPPPGMGFVFLGVWIVGSVFMLWISAALKRVSVDGRQLVVSNYRREILVPFNAILDVRQNRWVNLRPITIYLRDATEFGDRITFMPKQRMVFRSWRVDPVVDELKQLAGLMPRA